MGVGFGGSGWVCVGVLLKLLVQPFQVVLLALYRQLNGAAFLYYLGCYYVFGLAVLFTALVLPFGVFLVGGGWVWVAAVGGVLGACVVGVSASQDVRATLAYSTALNVGFLLAAAACLL